MEKIEQLGIIAGHGEFPLLLARSARAHGVKRLLCVGLVGETQPEMEPLVDEIEWVKLGQVGRLIEAFTKRGIHHALMAGYITPSNLFKKLGFDLRALAILARVKVRNAETLFGALAAEMEKDGVHLLDSRTFLGDSVPQAGLVTGKKLSDDEQHDVDFGWKIAKAVSALDIGQTVIVKKGTVLAVEGLENTDACIRRGGELSGDSGGATVVKVSKPKQDFRFDVPCIGTRTIDVCAEAKIRVLAIEAGSTLLLGREKIIEAAARTKLKIVAVAGENKS